MIILWEEVSRCSVDSIPQSPLIWFTLVRCPPPQLPSESLQVLRAFFQMLGPNCPDLRKDNCVRENCRVETCDALKEFPGYSQGELQVKGGGGGGLGLEYSQES